MWGCKWGRKASYCSVVAKFSGASQGQMVGWGGGIFGNLEVGVMSDWMRCDIILEFLALFRMRSGTQKHHLRILCTRLGLYNECERMSGSSL